MVTQVLPPQFRRNYFLSIANGVFFNVANAFLAGTTLIPVFVSQLTASALLIGLAAGLETAGWLFPQAFVGVLTLHHTYQKPQYLRVALMRVIVFATLVFTIFSLGKSRPTLCLILFFLLFSAYAVGGGLAGVAFMDIVGKTIPPFRRGSLWGWRMALGGTAAAFLGIAVKKILESYPFPTNFGLVFLCALFAITAGLICFSFVIEPAGTNRLNRVSLREGLQKSWEIFKQDASYKQLYMVRVLIGAYVIGAPFYIVYGVRHLHYPPEIAGIFLTTQMAGMVLSNLIWAYMGNYISNRLVLFYSSICSAIPPLIFFLGYLIPLPVGTYAVIFFFLGATEAGAAVGYLNYVLEIAPEQLRPLYTGFLHTIIAPTVALSAVGGLIINVTSYTVLYSLTLVIAVIAIITAKRLALQKK